MHGLLSRDRVAHRWVLLMLTLQLCGFGAADASWLPSAGASATPALARAVTVWGVPAPMSRRGVEEMRATAEGPRGSAVRAREAGPFAPDGTGPVLPVADVPATLRTQVRGLGSVVVPARRAAGPGVRADTDARGPPRGRVVPSVVPPIRSAG